MNNNNIIVFDYETSSLDTSSAVILQIASVAINGRNFQIEDKFQSYIKPENLDIITPEITAVNGITKEIVQDSPQENVVFPKWAEWISRYSGKKGSIWDNPLASGWNITNYDMPILERYCKKYGYTEAKTGRQKLFHPVFILDTMQYYWWLTRTNNDLRSISLGSILEYTGMPKDEISKGAHNAIWDVEQTAALTVKILKLGQFLTELRDDGSRRLELKNSLIKKAEEND